MQSDSTAPRRRRRQRSESTKAVWCLLAAAAAAPLSTVDAFSMVAPQLSPSEARATSPAWKTALRHPNELTDELSKIRQQKEQRDSIKQKKKKEETKKQQQQHVQQEVKVPAHANALFVADPTQESVLSQPIFKDIVLQHQKQQQAKSAFVRNVAEFVVAEAQNQQLAKGRAVLLSQTASELHTRTLSDVVFAQESMEHLWRVAGEAVVDFGLYDSAQGLASLNLDGAFQVDE